MVGRVENERVGGHAQLAKHVQDPPLRGVGILGDGDRARPGPAPGTEALLDPGVGLRPGIEHALARVLAELDVEGTSLGHARADERDGGVGAGERLARVGVFAVVRAPVRRRAGTRVEPMPRWIQASEVPLPKMGGGVALRAQELGHRRGLGGKLVGGGRGNDPRAGTGVVRSPLAHKGHLQLRGAAAGEDRGSGRRATR